MFRLLDQPTFYLRNFGGLPVIFLLTPSFYILKTMRRRQSNRPV